MQVDFINYPMIKNHIVQNMPFGGYAIVSSRLKNLDIKINNQSLLRQIRELKKGFNATESSRTIIKECLTFMLENNIELDKYCLDFLDGG